MSSILGESIPLQSPPFGGLPNRLWMVATICPVMWNTIFDLLVSVVGKKWQTYSPNGGEQSKKWVIYPMVESVKKSTTCYHLLPYPNSAVNQLLKTSTPPTATTRRLQPLDFPAAHLKPGHGLKPRKPNRQGSWTLAATESQPVGAFSVCIYDIIYIYTVCIYY